MNTQNKISEIINIELGYGLEPANLSGGRMAIKGAKNVVLSLTNLVKDVADKYALWKGNLTQADHKSITGDLYDHFIQNIYR